MSWELARIVLVFVDRARERETAQPEARIGHVVEIDRVGLLRVS